MIRLTGLPDYAQRLVYTPDGRELVAAYHHGRGVNGLVRWDWAAGRVTQRITRVAVGLSPCGDFHARAGGRPTLYAGRGRTPVGKASVLAFLPAGLAVAPGGGELMVLAEGAVRFHAMPEGGLVHSARRTAVDRSPGYSPGGRWAFAATIGAVRLWDRHAGHRLVRLKANSSPGIAVAPDDRTAAVSGPAGIVLWDLTARPTPRLTVPGGGSVFAWTPDGGRLLAAGPFGVIRLIDAADGRVLAEYDFGIGGVHALAVAPDGLTAAAAGAGTDRPPVVVVWDL